MSTTQTYCSSSFYGQTQSHRSVQVNRRSSAGVVGNGGRLAIRQFGGRARAGLAEVRSGGRVRVGNGCTGRSGLRADYRRGAGRSWRGGRIGQIWLQEFDLYYRNLCVKNVQICFGRFTPHQAYSLPAHI